MLLHFITAPREKRQPGATTTNQSAPESIWDDIIDRHADTAKPLPKTAAGTHSNRVSLSQAA
ncbi:MAG: hypothetical protein FOGNACKC_00382 [Anaerolineae bacterium]|nr:hypothetical protein [Anaerolineae bacterium]